MEVLAATVTVWGGIAALLALLLLGLLLLGSREEEDLRSSIRTTDRAMCTIFLVGGVLETLEAISVSFLLDRNPFLGEDEDDDLVEDDFMAEEGGCLGNAE